MSRLRIHGLSLNILDTQDLLDLSDSITNYYPLASEVNPHSATTTYNCHAFAWHIVENGSPIVWIGYDPGITGEDIYWGDGSYIEVSGIIDGSKISYAGDHSAIVLSGTKCRSKWGAWPLVDHPVGYGPLIYNMSQRKYYTSFHMEGPSILCSSTNATYSTPAYVNCTYNWSYDTSRFNYVSGQGTNNFQVAPKSPLGSGQAWVKLTLTINSPINITRETTKNIWVGSPQTPVISSSSPYNWSSAYGYPMVKEFTVVPSQDIDLYDESIIYGGLIENFQWTWNSDNVGNLYDMDAGHTMFLMDYPGSARIRVKVSNSCDETDWSLPVFVQATEGFALLPNPASDNLTITMNEKESVSPIITSDGANKSITQNATASVSTDYIVRIFNHLGTLKYNTTKSGKSFIIPVNNLQNGNYFINISDGKTSNSRQFIVKH